MKFNIFPLLILGIITFLTSCSEKPVVVTGQVFVVTESRENIKMGLVPIHLLTDAEFQKITVGILPIIEDLSRIDAQRKKNADYLSKFIRKAQTGALGRYLGKVDLDEIESAVIREIGSALVVDATPLEPSVFQQSKSKLIARLSPTSIVTNADGLFKAEMTEKLWLIAYGMRVVGSEQEEYLWIVPLEPDKNKREQEILISNNYNIETENELYELMLLVNQDQGSLKQTQITHASLELVEKLHKFEAYANETILRADREAAAAKAESERRAAEAERRAAEIRAESQKKAAEARAEALEKEKIKHLEMLRRWGMRSPVINVEIIKAVKTRKGTTLTLQVTNRTGLSGMQISMRLRASLYDEKDNVISTEVLSVTGIGSWMHEWSRYDIEFENIDPSSVASWKFTLVDLTAKSGEEILHNAERYFEIREVRR
jgi:hypothetical protein